MPWSQHRRKDSPFTRLLDWLTDLRVSQARWALEPLESRNVPAITASFDTGILTVVGDGADDTIVVFENGGVEVLGTTIAGGPISASAVVRIDVDGGAGADFIDLRGVSAATGFVALNNVSVTGGFGNDLIFGADDVASSQFLEGGQDDDTVTGGNGDEFIAGGYFFNSFGFTDPNGNDSLVGEAGDDFIVGDDFVAGPGRNDTLVGGTGDDTLQGQLGDDLYLFGDDWGADEITELGGIDTIDFGLATVPINFGSNVGAPPAGTANSLEWETDDIERYFGGAGDDTFTFGPGANFGGGTGVLNGREGLNTLDYTNFGSTATVTFVDGVAQATGIGRSFNIQQAINATVTGTPPPIIEPSSLASNPNSQPALNQVATDDHAEAADESHAILTSERTHNGHTTPGGGSVTAVEPSAESTGQAGVTEEPVPADAAESEPAEPNDT